MGAGYAAIVIKRERDLVEHFTAMRATSPAAAQSVEALRVEHNHFFRRLEQRAVIRQAPNGLYYLDQPSWDAMNAMRRRTVIVVLVIAVAVMASIAFTVQSRERQQAPPAVNAP